MDLPSQKGFNIFGMALLLGILGDALLRATPWGINLPLWLGVALATGWAFLPVESDGSRRIGPWPIAAAAFFGLCFAWRDAGFLQFWNAVAVLCAIALPALQLHGVRLGLARVSDYAAGLAASGINAAFGTLVLAFRDMEWKGVPAHVGRLRAVTIGVVLTVPTLVVFGGLLAGADPGFERVVHSLIFWDLSTMVSHIMLAGFFAWVSAGYLRTLATADDLVLKAVDGLRADSVSPPKFGVIELGIPLGALALTFLVFVILQARYLFGGEAMILETTGLTYAEYARGGFFELMVVSMLLLPLLLGSDWLLDRDRPKDVLGIRAICAALLVLTALMMLSAMQRMSLYVGAYGLTLDRFYATAFMGWLAVMLALFGATVLRGKPGRFAFGSLVAGFGTLAILNAVNPDAVVARTNLSRAEAGAELDVEYVGRLSADALPVLIARSPELLPGERCESFRERILTRIERDGTDWRSWNLGRSRARRAVAATGLPECAPVASPDTSQSPDAPLQNADGG